LVRYVRGLGCRPVLAGNMKGLHDPYRTPKTQADYAKRFGQKPKMVTSFADGTKIAMEMAVVANATGFVAGRRGMYGPECEEVGQAARLFPERQMLDRGLVDYVLCGKPPGGVFVIGWSEDRMQQDYLRYYKLGEGPFYVFYTPYHLCHLECPASIARAALFGDATVAPLGGPICQVAAAAKRDLQIGETLDHLGGFTTYGVLENADPFRDEGLLPIGLAPGSTLRRSVEKDELLRWDDVHPPREGLALRLWLEQEEAFAAEKPLSGSPSGRAPS
jgi:predicted homoserine dehydrogenase-like protein